MTQHNQYEDAFSETSFWDKLKKYAKAAGKVRMEGKEYVMHDGDVVEFRFNV